MLKERHTVKLCCMLNPRDVNEDLRTRCKYKFAMESFSVHFLTCTSGFIFRTFVFFLFIDHSKKEVIYSSVTVLLKISITIEVHFSSMFFNSGPRCVILHSLGGSLSC